MDLFTPATHTSLNCDAYLIDTDRRARPLCLRPLVPHVTIVEALLDRVMLMGRSLHDGAEQTFGVFVGLGEKEFVVAPTEPFHAGVASTLRSVLLEYGPVSDNEPVDLATSGLEPLLAYERGAVSFFLGGATRDWLPLAGNRGLRIRAATLSHSTDTDLELPEVTG